jgi:hypothetical protein
VTTLLFEYSANNPAQQHLAMTQTVSRTGYVPGDRAPVVDNDIGPLVTFLAFLLIFATIGAYSDVVATAFRFVVALLDMWVISCVLSQYEKSKAPPDWFDLAYLAYLAFLAWFLVFAITSDYGIVAATSLVFVVALIMMVISCALSLYQEYERRRQVFQQHRTKLLPAPATLPRMHVSANAFQPLQRRPAERLVVVKKTTTRLSKRLLKQSKGIWLRYCKRASWPAPKESRSVRLVNSYRPTDRFGSIVQYLQSDKVKRT